MNILYPDGSLVVIPQAETAGGMENGTTVFRNAAGKELGALTVSGAVVLPDDTDYTYECPENNPRVHDGKR